MKILFPVNSFYPAQVGGTCNSVYAIAKGLAAKRHDVLVVATNSGLTKEHNITLDAITEFEGFEVVYGSPSILTNFSKLLSPFSVIPKNLAKNIKSFNPDIIHLSSLFHPISLFSALIARKQGIPYIWSPHGELGRGAIDKKALKKKLFLSMPFVRKNILTTSRFHVTATEEGIWLEGFLKAKFPGLQSDVYDIIGNMVDNEMFEKDLNEERSNKYPDKYILFLSRISRKKNIEALISAFAKIKINTDARLVIAGWAGEDPAYTNELKKLVISTSISGRVVFTEKSIEGAEKRALYRNAEILVLPSYSENFGMVVVEAMAQGTPVIASKGTPWGELESKNCGYWVENSVESISKTLEKHFLLSKNETAVMSENAIEFAREFSIDKLTDKYIDMYERVISAR